MTTGYLHSIESMGLLDGPGIRTIFFLQGCQLRCEFCHNPDTQAFTRRQPIEAEEVLRLAKRYRSYYGKEGGVTFSGGEPLAQGAFLYDALTLLKKEGYNTCIDTSGVGNPKEVARLLPYVDRFLLDIKAFTPEAFEKLTAVKMRHLYRFMDMLRDEDFQGKLWIRHVMIPGRTDSEKYMDSFVDTIGPLRKWVERIEILPYHVMGVDKYAELGRSYPLEGVPAMDKDRAKELEAYARERFRAAGAVA